MSKLQNYIYIYQDIFNYLATDSKLKRVFCWRINIIYLNIHVHVHVLYTLIGTTVGKVNMSPASNTPWDRTGLLTLYTKNSGGPSKHLIKIGNFFNLLEL